MSHVLRPLNFDQILDHGFDLYRSNFTVLFALALLPQLPMVVFWLLAPALSTPGSDTSLVDIAPVLMLPYNLAAVVLMMGAITHAVALAYAGESPTIGESMRRGLQRWLTVAVASVVAYMLVMFGFILLIIPGLILLSMVFAIVPAAVLEDCGPLESLERSRALSRGARLRVLGIMALAWLITLLPAMGMWAVAGVTAGGRGALLGAAGTADSLWLTGTMQAAGIVIGALTWPFLMIVTVLLYYDRRARTEAPDLEDAAAALSGAV